MPPRSALDHSHETRSGTTAPTPRRLVELPWNYQTIFVREWSPYFGAVVIVAIALALMASGFFWGVFGGLKLLGNYINNLIGLGPLLGIKSELESPLMHRVAILDICLVLGAFSAALLSGQFRISRPPKLEYLWAALGGSCMGIGASLAGGCTTGGFFTPVMFSSPAGWAMWAGLLAGALGWSMAMRAMLWTSLSGYALLLARWSGSRKASLIFPLALLLGESAS